ncbi:MAG: translation initiation factor IF-2 [Opitutales bacterium]
MSVRIHQLSKDIGMENKELLALLRSRGFEVKSASSTIDNISADAIREEYAQSAEATPAETPAPEQEAKEEKPAAPQIPAGAFVKSAEDIQREREAKAAAEKEKAEANKPKPVEPKPVESLEPPAPKAPEPPRPTTPPRPPAPPTPPAGGPPRPPSPPRTAPMPPKPPVPQASPERPQTPPASAEELTETAETTEEPVDALKTIRLKPPIVVRDFATEIGLKPFKLISELMEMGIFASMNQSIEEDIAKKLAERHGCILEIQHRGEGSEQGTKKVKEEKPADDDPRFLEPRPPVVCILGHVDHGKTTLLDSIRNANVTAGEAGGITQHIGAYQIEHNGHKISFVDTPGHAAFSKMRSRGANVTDIAVLVIAADDAFKPQTDEALKFAREANNAIVVAINKIDAKGANIDRVKQQMQEKGIAPEEWGGETVTVEVSALKGTNIEDLLDMIMLQAEVLELKANPNCPPSGTVVESQVEVGRGATATVIVERGTLKQGDALLCGEVYCRVKTMTDADGKPLKSVPPGTPARVMGWSDVPASGAKFTAEKNEKTAKRAAEEAMQLRKLIDAAASADKSGEGGAATLEDLFAAIESQQKKCLRVIVKSDVHGSTEALVSALEEIESDKVDLQVISKGVGHVTKNDVTLASAGGATIVGFNVKLDNGVQSLAKHHDVRIVQHEIIYELIDRVEEAMAELLDAEYIERKSGAAEIRQIFSVGKGRNVAGCMITEGTIKRNGLARLMRGGELIHEGKIDTLKRFKDDVKEVRAGYECGVNISGFNDYQEGDIIECFEVEEQRPSLR